MSYERQPIADHAINLASTIQNNLKRSLEAIGVVRPAAPVHVGWQRCRDISRKGTRAVVLLETTHVVQMPLYRVGHICRILCCQCFFLAPMITALQLSSGVVGTGHPYWLREADGPAHNQVQSPRCEANPL